MNYGARASMVGTLLVVIARSLVSLIAVIGEVFFFFLFLKNLMVILDCMNFCDTNDTKAA